MSQKNNVIDIRSQRIRKKSSQNVSSVDGPQVSSLAQIVDMTEKRSEILDSERRQVKRTLLTEFIGAFAIVPQSGLLRVSLYDISEDGVAFDLDLEKGGFKNGEEIALRVYLNQYTYFPFVVKASHVRPVEEEGVVRHGCVFVKETLNKEALHHFVKFIETVSASLESDHGDIMVSRLNQI